MLSLRKKRRKDAKLFNGESNMGVERRRIVGHWEHGGMST